MNKTMIVNAFAGPGAGKTTSAWHIGAELKKEGYVVEYVSEYAKDLIWDNNLELLNGTIENQTIVYNEQKHRIDRLLGKVDIVVTDSPIILSSLYLNKQITTKEDRMKFTNKILKDWSQYRSFNYFVERNNNNYEQQGRLQNLAQSQMLDKEIKDFLNEHNIYYGTYNHKTINVVLSNIIRNFNNDNTIQEPKKEKTSLAYKKIDSNYRKDMISKSMDYEL